MSDRRIIAIQTSGPDLGRKSESAPAFVGKLEPKTLQAWQALEPALQRRAETIIREHFRASQLNGCDIVSFDRVVVEAIEVAQIEARQPEAPGPRRAMREPYWKYDVYVSPVGE